MEPLFVAVDLGAGSGRVFLAGVGPDELLLEEIHRFRYPPARRGGHLRWDLPLILKEIKSGLCEAGTRARQLGRPVISIGVDSWGVDYGFIDSKGELLEDPICYRDERTSGMMESVFARIPRDEVFDRTGIQFLVFNTLFQLKVHVESGVPGKAARLLLIPDLVNLFLTGRAVTEFTNATTTQLIDARIGSWDTDLIELLGLSRDLFAEIVPAGTDLGPLKSELAKELDLEGVRVVAPATHDTGSAVAGAPLQDGWAYISSGTWSLVGVERKDVLINSEVARHNFTNEGGAFGTVRFLKNVMGLWILESCRREWKEKGLKVNYDHLLAEVQSRNDISPLIFPDEPAFLNPPSMLAALRARMAENAKPTLDPPLVAKGILDSLALRYASVTRIIEKLTKQNIKGLQIVGGGCLNDYLNQTTADATGLPVMAGPVEATVTGNVLVQAVAAGRFESLVEAREHVRKNVQSRRFEPQPSPDWAAIAHRYDEIEAAQHKSLARSFSEA